MPREHDSQGGVRIAAGNDVAVQVGSYVVGEIGYVAAHDFLHRLLIARGAGGFEDVFEEFFGRAIHSGRKSLVVSC